MNLLNKIKSYMIDSKLSLDSPNHSTKLSHEYEINEFHLVKDSQDVSTPDDCPTPEEIFNNVVEYKNKILSEQLTESKIDTTTIESDSESLRLMINRLEYQVLDLQTQIDLIKLKHKTYLEHIHKIEEKESQNCEKIKTSMMIGGISLIVGFTSLFFTFQKNK